MKYGALSLVALILGVAAAGGRADNSSRSRPSDDGSEKHQPIFEERPAVIRLQLFGRSREVRIDDGARLALADVETALRRHRDRLRLRSLPPPRIDFRVDREALQGDVFELLDECSRVFGRSVRITIKMK
jgi:hypothetical protein